MAATTTNPQSPSKNYVLYVDDNNEHHAAGPFVGPGGVSAARLFAAGMRLSDPDGDKCKVLGVVTNLVGFSDITIEKPDLGDEPDEAGE